MIGGQNAHRRYIGSDVVFGWCVGRGRGISRSGCHASGFVRDRNRRLTLQPPANSRRQDDRYDDQRQRTTPWRGCRKWRTDVRRFTDSASGFGFFQGFLDQRH
jgi:hypothetical protein